MKCPNCSYEQTEQQMECLRCGIIFEKYHQHREIKPSVDRKAIGNSEPAINPREFIKDLLFYVKPETNSFIFASRVLVLLILLIWGMRFIFSEMESRYALESFWHLVNLPFHEAGHILFRPFGRLMTSLGGSIMQVLMPLICLTVFLVKTRDTFAASFALWWTGENFMDLAPYINDARSLTLPLLGGNTGKTSPYGFHDWEFILRETGLLRYDHFLAGLAHTLGTVLMLCAFAWGGYIIHKQYKNLNHSQ